MSAQILIKKLNQEVEGLKDDMREIKKFLFAPIRDSEGDYKKSFVKKMLVRSKNLGPFYKFANKESFLNHVQSKK